MTLGGLLLVTVALSHATPDQPPYSRDPQAVPYLLAPPAVIDINTGRQLFVDDYLVAQTNLSRTFHRPVPHSDNPILRPDQTWESAGALDAYAMPFSDGVLYDEQAGKYKMWYLARAPADLISAKPEGGYVTCYAESDDGIHWVKPLLDVVPGTNIVETVRRDANDVVIDPRATDPARRFIMVSTLRPTDDPEEKRWALSLRYSADGIHWGPVAATSGAIDWLGDRNSLYFDPFRGVWVLSLRNSIRRDPDFHLVRVRHHFETDDLAAGLSRLERHPWVRSDRLDPSHPRFPDYVPQLYNLDAFPYESLMVGLFTVLRGPENDDAKRLNIHKRNEIFTAFSRDGLHWDRPDRRPFIGVNETDGAWNWGNVQSASGGAIIVGDQLYFYYSGRQWSSAAGRSEGATGVAMLRRDGFASMDAADSPGILITRQVAFTGAHLFVNADVAAGELRVEVLDPQGRVIAPYSFANCTPLTADGTKQRVHWNGTDNLESLAGQPVRLRFQLRQGSLFSFWISRDSTGASSGRFTSGGSAPLHQSPSQ
ncbi:MAG: hypothetical protein H7A44_08190 [Opitutaceae bacterium]|nr:hypothetical protein [Cephaloticoccus sp.]MCP5530409.1 hypothetical protein [Opitutaceae bacterium]